MSGHLQPPLAPMEAKLTEQIPSGDNWQFEPKWDGFRCLAFRRGRTVELQSKAGESLTRYFPELVAELLKVEAKQFVLDGEIVIPTGQTISFDHLLMRIHPAASRVRKLAAETPALYIVFDLLEDAQGRALINSPLAERRQRLEQFAGDCLSAESRILLSPATRKPQTARRWYAAAGKALDGIVAKRIDLPYQSGNRQGMLKIKPTRTADCVVGGFRYAAGKREVGSLLLGLYDRDGKLNHVGFTSSIKTSERKTLTAKLQALIHPPGFTGNAPGGPSRWSTKRSTEWQPLKPKLVVEVQYDHFTGGRFRHGTKLVRWRPDKAPAQCRIQQVARHGAGTLRLLAGSKRGGHKTKAKIL